jgi:hypothetical protein
MMIIHDVISHIIRQFKSVFSAVNEFIQILQNEMLPLVYKYNK